jgi:hypothetical protein
MAYLKFMWIGSDGGNAHFGSREKVCNFLTSSATVSFSKNSAAFCLYSSSATGGQYGFTCA